MSTAVLHGSLRPMDGAVLERPAPRAAVELLGALLLRAEIDGSMTAARIVEVEAYTPDDPASHSVGGRTPRNASMFAAPGTAYVYRSYGVHWCCNVSVERLGVGAAVLLRAAVVIDGERWVRARRRQDTGSAQLLRGPGNLARGLDIDAHRHDGIDLLAGRGGLSLSRDELCVTPAQRTCGPRVGVSRAPDVSWRWWLTDEPAVSRYRRSQIGRAHV